mmetsp:Transcript_42727/g.129798  ORF Transcript_42727/g.129798 Transcript_42727/m.129798 type:complete len:220 (+) Transcript_42727:724-1383(+)
MSNAIESSVSDDFECIRRHHQQRNCSDCRSSTSWFIEKFHRPSFAGGLSSGAGACYFLGFRHDVVHRGIIPIYHCHVYNLCARNIPQNQAFEGTVFASRSKEVSDHRLPLASSKVLARVANGDDAARPALQADVGRPTSQLWRPSGRVLLHTPGTQHSPHSERQLQQLRQGNHVDERPGRAAGGGNFRRRRGPVADAPEADLAPILPQSAAACGVGFYA